MISKAVVDLTFGDSGKGMVTSSLCHYHQSLNSRLVVRYSGGQQAGHNVVLNKTKHVFSNFGSGSFFNVPTYWSKYCTIDPFAINNELKELNNKGISPQLYIDRSCPVTTPFEKDFNLTKDKKDNHGTCGCGVGQTWQREEDFHSILFSDLFHPNILKIKLNLLEKYYGKKPYSSISKFLYDCEELTGKENIVMASKIPDSYYEVIFEGSQGILLDQHNGFFPHVTRSNTGLKNIIEMGFSPDVYFVTRAYQTRHGNGPMTNEDLNTSFIRNNNYEQNFDIGIQGIFRKTMLDIDLLNYSLDKEWEMCQGKKILVITCLDLIDKYFFTYKNQIIESKTMKGFISDIVRLLDFAFDEVKLSFDPYPFLTDFT